ncbi:MAG: AraC family transcriptional regulator [Chitinophagaceae bacterium]
MKPVLHKSGIPPSQLFVIRRLNEKYFDASWHAHCEYQIFVVLEGTGTRFVGDSIKSFGPGELVMTGPHLPHVWRSDEFYFERNNSARVSGIVIYLNENFLGDRILDKEEMLGIRKLFKKSTRGLQFYGAKKSVVIKLMEELTELQGISGVIHLLKILEILAGSKEYQFISSLAYDEAFDQQETDRLNKVYEYAFKNFRKKIVLNDVAQLLHITPTSFSRYFTTKNNKPFSRFISEIRIKHACKMLTETDETIAQICYESGFNTLSNFNKQFKEIMQKKPTQYKREFLSI